MKYNAPVLLEVGQAAAIVLGFLEGGTDNMITYETLDPALALGLDE